MSPAQEIKNVIWFLKIDLFLKKNIKLFRFFQLNILFLFSSN